MFEYLEKGLGQIIKTNASSIILFPSAYNFQFFNKEPTYLKVTLFDISTT